MKKERNFLEKLRGSLDLSQSDVARKIGVSRPTYILIEKGKKDLTLNQAQTLSGLYNVPIEAIRTGKNTIISEKDIVTVMLPTNVGVFEFNVWNQKKGVVFHEQAMILIFQ